MKSKFDVFSVSPDQLAEVGWWRKMDAGIVWLPNARRLPVGAREPLLDFLRRGGKLVCVGAPLFAEPLFPVDGAWLTANDITVKRGAISAQAQLVDAPTEDFSRWQRGTNNTEAPSLLRSEQTDKGAAFRLDTVDLKGWDKFSKAYPTSPFPANHTLTCFEAKGSRDADFLSVEWEEKDGFPLDRHRAATIDLAPFRSLFSRLRLLAR